MTTSTRTTRTQEPSSALASPPASGPTRSCSCASTRSSARSRCCRSLVTCGSPSLTPARTSGSTPRTAVVVKCSSTPSGRTSASSSTTTSRSTSAGFKDLVERARRRAHVLRQLRSATPTADSTSPNPGASRSTATKRLRLHGRGTCSSRTPAVAGKTTRAATSAESRASRSSFALRCTRRCRSG